MQQLRTPAENEPQPCLRITITDTASQIPLALGLEALALAKGWQTVQFQVLLIREETNVNQNVLELPNIDDPLLNPDEVFLRLLKKNRIEEASQASLLNSFRRLRENCEAILSGEHHQS